MRKTIKTIIKPTDPNYAAWVKLVKKSCVFTPTKKELDSRDN